MWFAAESFVSKMLISVLLVTLFLFQVQSQDTCKNPYVEKLILAHGVPDHSPYYVIALPKTPVTQEMDNVCYTYFENDGGGFFHIMSITFKNGTNTYYEFVKEDIPNRMGIAEAKSDECVFHDYILKPICNFTIFILYRCYIQGKCSSNIDIGAVPGVDVRVTVAGNPKVSPDCQAEMESRLRDTSTLAGDDYILLPQKLTPNCVTKYNNLTSFGEKRALGTMAVSNELTDRFSENQPVPPSPKPVAAHTTQGISHSSGDSYTDITKNSGSFGASHSSAGPGQTPIPVWPWPPNNVQKNPQPWNGQTMVPGAETHHHIWQSAATAAALKTIASKNPNVYYHIHSWEQRTGCCKCV